MEIPVLTSILNLAERYGLTVILLLGSLWKINSDTNKNTTRFEKVINGTNEERKETQRQMFQLVENHLNHNTDAMNKLSDETNNRTERSAIEHDKIVQALGNLQNQCSAHIGKI